MPVAVAAVAVAAVGTGYSIYAGERANKQQKKAAKAEQARSDLQYARQRRDAIREARAAYASSQQSAENQGVANSSSALGGQASIAAQLGSNLSFLDQYKVYTDQASAALASSASWNNRAQTGSQIAGLAMDVAGNANAIQSSAQKIFKPR
jgi:hypothetical protein